MLVEAVSRFPEEAAGWWRLGNLHYQHNIARGHSTADSGRELERAVALDPNSVMPQIQLGWVKTVQGDEAGIADAVKIFPPAMQRSILAFTTGSQADRDSILASDGLCDGDKTTPVIYFLGFPDNYRNGIDFLEARLLCEEIPPADRAWTALTLAHLNAGIGRWQEAGKWFEEVSDSFRPFRLEYEALAWSLPFAPFDEDRIRELIGDLERWQPLVEPSYVDPEQSRHLQKRFNPNLKVHEQLRLYCVAALEIRLGDLAAALLQGNPASRTTQQKIPQTLMMMIC